MKDTQALQRHLGSLFVVAAFLDDFSGGLSANISMTVGMASARMKPCSVPFSAHSAFPLSAVVGAAQDICTRSAIADEDDLEEMLDAVKRQFDIVDECDERDGEVALDNLEHVFELAAWAARETWSEVAAGFPISGGDFPAWKDELWQRRHGAHVRVIRDARDLPGLG